MADQGSKTEKATHKKRQDERKKGNFFSSKDIVSVVSLLAVAASIKVMFPSMYHRLDVFIQKYMNYALYMDELTVTGAGKLFLDGVELFAFTAFPVLLMAVVSSIVATGAQTRFMFSRESLQPKFSRMNPISGFAKLLSLRSFVEIVKGLLKIAVIGGVVYWYISGRILDFSKLPFMELTQAIQYILDCIVGMMIDTCIIFTALSALDYFYQRWDYERQIKMSKHEVKEEYKQLEGDPQVKGRIKNLQRKFAMSRMMQAVPTADVIIRNPTHFAVALKYDTGKSEAPIVVAKGQDEVALRIVKIGEENGVFIQEDRVLARALFAGVEINREIPLEYYSAVAEVLALLYRMKNKNI